MLVPTRELAVQVHQMTERLAQFTDIRAALVVGGLSLNTQVRERERERDASEGGAVGDTPPVFKLALWDRSIVELGG
jgi:tRNA A37 threonylcarbamoyltransferase TsaD